MEILRQIEQIFLTNHLLNSCFSTLESFMYCRKVKLEDNWKLSTDKVHLVDSFMEILDFWTLGFLYLSGMDIAGGHFLSLLLRVFWGALLVTHMQAILGIGLVDWVKQAVIESGLTDVCFRISTGLGLPWCQTDNCLRQSLLPVKQGNLMD
jgi:hypothetical protein